MTMSMITHPNAAELARAVAQWLDAVRPRHTAGSTIRLAWPFHRAQTAVLGTSKGIAALESELHLIHVPQVSLPALLQQPAN